MIESAGSTQRTARILVVEDSPTQLEELRFLLAEAGFSVVAATDGREGLKAATTNAIDLVVSDVVMPEIDGYAFCKALRADDNLHQVPVILLTALASPEDVLRGLECGASGFITKPFEGEFLVAQVHRALASDELPLDANGGHKHSVWYGGQARLIDADSHQMLELLLSTYANAVHQNMELVRTREKLRTLNQELEERVLVRTAELSAEVAVSQQLHMELEIEQVEALQAKDQLMAQVAHELRTPLSAALHFVTLLSEGLAGSINEEQRQDLEVVTRNMNHMRAMISDLTDVCRAVAGKLAVKQARADIALLIHRVVANSRPKAALRDITITIELKGDIPPVYADDARVTEVLTNLVDNAIKFASRDSSMHIEASCWAADPEYLCVSVHNSGSSLTPEIAEHIFQRLFQGTQEASESRQGLGLGLFICQQIVNLHGGKIWVDVDSAEGPTFVFTLPLYDLAGVLHPVVSHDDWLSRPHTLMVVEILGSTGQRIPEVELSETRAQVQTVVERTIRLESDTVLPVVAGIPASVLPVICQVDATVAAVIVSRIEYGLSRPGATIDDGVKPRVTVVGEIPTSIDSNVDTHVTARAVARWLEQSISSYVSERGPSV